MKTKYIISFLFLTIILMMLSYYLLGIIDKHVSFLNILLVAVLVMADLAAIAKLFLRFIKPTANNK